MEANVININLLEDPSPYQKTGLSERAPSDNSFGNVRCVQPCDDEVRRIQNICPSQMSQVSPSLYENGQMETECLVNSMFHYTVSLINQVERERNNLEMIQNEIKRCVEYLRTESLPGNALSELSKGTHLSRHENGELDPPQNETQKVTKPVVSDEFPHSSDQITRHAVNVRTNEVENKGDLRREPVASQQETSVTILSNITGKTSITPRHHMFYFLKYLLTNRTHYYHCIEWLDKKAGVFQFVQADEVARLWGIRKRRTGMTYKNFSRALRVNIKMGILKKMPRHYVYSFTAKFIFNC